MELVKTPQAMSYSLLESLAQGTFQKTQILDLCRSFSYANHSEIFQQPTKANAAEIKNYWRAQYRLGSEVAGDQPCWRVLVHNKSWAWVSRAWLQQQNQTGPWAAATGALLAAIEMWSFHSGLVKLHLNCCVQFRLLHFKKEKQTGEGSNEGCKDDQRAGEPAPWGKAEGVRSSIKVFQYLEGRHKEERSSFFTRRHMEKTRTMCTSCIISSWYEKGNFYSENNNSVEQPYQENGPHHRRFWIWDQSGC